MRRVIFDICQDVFDSLDFVLDGLIELVAALGPAFAVAAREPPPPDVTEVFKRRLAAKRPLGIDVCQYPSRRFRTP